MQSRAPHTGTGLGNIDVFLCLSPKIVDDAYPSLLCHSAQEWPKGSAEVSGLIHKKAPKDELTSFTWKRSG